VTGPTLALLVKFFISINPDSFFGSVWVRIRNVMLTQIRSFIPTISQRFCLRNIFYCKIWEMILWEDTQDNNILCSKNPHMHIIYRPSSSNSPISTAAYASSWQVSVNSASGYL